MIKGSREEEIYNELLSFGIGDKYSKPGVYSISIGERLVYVGKARDMLVRIANHIKEIEVN
jgi:excinuclease UvrABC nuclease subunit